MLSRRVLASSALPHRAVRRSSAVFRAVRSLQQCAQQDAPSPQSQSLSWAARNAMVLLPHDSEEVQRTLDEVEAFQVPSIVDHLPPVPQGRSRLFLCRHGQTDSNLLNTFQGRGVNTTINQTGVQQAACLAHCLRHVPISAIFSSSLHRAHQTAIIASHFHQPLEVEAFSDLEEMCFGVMEGQPHARFEREMQDAQRQWRNGDFSTPLYGGECPLDVVKRGSTKIQELMQCARPQEQVMVVSHGRFNKIVLAHLLYGRLHDMMTLTQDNTCINVVDFDHDTQSFELVLLNTTMHLPKHLFRPSYQ